MCNCTEAWEPPFCRVPVCSQQCDRGVCALPDVCRCFKGWAGSRCDVCEEGWAGDACNVACPDCGDFGVCDQGRNGTGECVCAPRFAGRTCRECSTGFFGPDCLELPATSYLQPGRGRDTGGLTTAVRGFHFRNTSSYTARFGLSGSDADRLVSCMYAESDRLLCPVPPSPAGSTGETRVTVRIFEDGARITYGSGDLSFVYEPVCPPSACGNGACSQGGCSCYIGWTGADCLTRVLAPRFVLPVAAQIAREGQAWSLPRLALSQGTSPVVWRLLGSVPRGMTIGSLSGTLSWPRPVARAEPYTVAVEASNVLGRDTVDLVLAVPLSYSAEVDVSSINGQAVGPAAPAELVVQPGSYLRLRGRVVPSFNDTPASGQPVDVWLLRPTRPESLVRVQSVIQGVFQYTWNFNNVAAGRFLLGATHPSDGDRAAGSGRYIVIHNARAAGSGRAQGYPGTYSMTASVENMGDLPLTGLQVALAPGVTLPPSISNLTLSAPDSVAPRSRATVTVTADIEGPYVDYFFYVRVTAQELGGRFVSLQYSVLVRDPRPRLSASPSSVTERVARGAQAQVAFFVQNTGGAESGPLSVRLPKVGMLSLVTPTVLPSLPAGNFTRIVLLVRPPAGAALGTSVTTFTVGNTQTGVGISLQLSVDVISTATGDLEVVAEDETYFFDPAQPRIEGAIVTATSSDGRVRLRATTSSNGTVVFRGIREAYYNVRIQSNGHGPYQETVLVSSPGARVRGFLPRQVVSYTWVVEPRPIQETYEFTLEADFVTNVPMPVVTITPQVVNLDQLEAAVSVAGETSYTYEVTNHGLIRADNLELRLPSNHPFIDFEWDAPLGDIEANTTVVVPVRVRRKPGSGRRRRSSSGCYNGVATYSVECAGTKYTGIGLTFSGGEPCGGDGGGGESDGGLSSGGFSAGGGVGGPCGWCSGGSSYYGSPAEFSSLDFCDPCTKNVFDCLIGFLVSCLHDRAF